MSEISIKAEADFLSSCILNPETLAENRLTAEHFERPAHKAIFGAIAACIDRDGKADLATVAEELSARGEIDRAGGIAGVASTLNSVPSAELAGQYAAIVRENFKRRRAERIGRELAAMMSEGGDIDAIDRAAAELNALSSDGKKEMTWQEKLIDFSRWIEKRAAGEMPGIPSGFDVLDKMTGGFQPGQLVILAARPAIGKTALALNFAMAAAMSGAGAVVLSLEMPVNLIISRLVSRYPGVTSEMMLTPIGAGEKLVNVVDALSALDRLPLDVIDRAETLADVLHYIRRASGRLVVVDYLQLIQAERRENRTQEVSAISRELKRAAVYYDVPVLALSQLNRAPEVRQDKRPALADLRDSGAIEQDADLVLMMYRENGQPLTEIRIAKNRNGETGLIRLYFAGDKMRFTPLSVEE